MPRVGAPSPSPGLHLEGDTLLLAVERLAVDTFSDLRERTPTWLWAVDVCCMGMLLFLGDAALVAPFGGGTMSEPPWLGVVSLAGLLSVSGDRRGGCSG